MNVFKSKKGKYMFSSEGSGMNLNSRLICHKLVFRLIVRQIGVIKYKQIKDEDIRGTILPGTSDIKRHVKPDKCLFRKMQKHIYLLWLYVSIEARGVVKHSGRGMRKPEEFPSRYWCVETMGFHPTQTKQLRPCIKRW